ncbi:MAG TPA: hypothetical protein ENN29_04640 [Candidatus Hydrogenedentes bacterium]|nr:hypothetical protein [Candidatus Hydrogenedentota bacterium]
MLRYALMAMLPALLVLSGCNTLSGQPQITRAAINPEVLEPGASAVITLSVKDRQNVVERIEGVVLEDPRITFRLRDDGQPPDEKAGDDEWSMQVDVPFQAPPGQFRLEFTAYGPDGLPVSIRDREGRVTPLQQTIPIIIQFPPE